MEATSQAQSPAPTSERPVSLTPAAADQIRQTMARQDLPNQVLRVAVRTGGCSGSEYALDFVPEARPGDLTFEDGGVRMAVDPGAVKVLAGTVIDFFDDGFRSGFSFKNPNARNTCGCGTSFQA